MFEVVLIENLFLTCGKRWRKTNALDCAQWFMLHNTHEHVLSPANVYLG